MKFYIKYKFISAKIQSELNNTILGDFQELQRDPVILISSNSKDGIHLCWICPNYVTGITPTYVIRSNFEPKPKRIATIPQMTNPTPNNNSFQYKEFEEIIKKTFEPRKTNKLPSEYYNDISEIFDVVTEENIIKRLFGYERNYDIYIVHKLTGWQQILGNYYYRDIGELVACNPMNVNSNYQLKYAYNIDIHNETQKKFDILLNFLNAADHKFTIPLFLYMLFSKCKSLFKQYNKTNIKVEQNGFAININKNTINPAMNFKAIDYIKKLNKNFFCFENIGDLDELEFVLSLNKEFSISYKQVEYCISKLVDRDFTHWYHLKNSKLKLSDFPVFKFNAKFANSSRNQIDISTLSAELKSKLSFIYYDIADKDDFFINISIPESINTELISALTGSYVTYGFHAIIIDYLNYITNIFNDIFQKHLKNVQKNIITEKLTETSHIKNAIQKYINEMLDITKSEKDDLYKIKLNRLIYRISRFNWNNFENLLRVTTSKDTHVMKDYFKKELNKLYGDLDDDEYPELDDSYIDINEVLHKASDIINGRVSFDDDIVDEENTFISLNRLNNIKEKLCEFMYEIYVKCVFHRCIFPQKHSPTYFNDLYKEALNELSTSDANKVSASRYAFLLTMLESFNQYLGDRMPEQASQFKDIYDETKELLHNLCKKEDYGTDKYWIKLFAEYLQTEIKQKNIIDVHSNKDTEIGWIDEDKGQIYLKNTGNFYDNFMIYAQQCGSNIHHSKTAFIREVLFANHVIQSRKDEERRRYDVERKINGKKRNVIAVIHNTLTSYLS